MPSTTLTPASTLSITSLPVTGTLTKAQSTDSYPFGIYATPAKDFYDANFISGALDQVAYTYKKLGGDVLDVELTEENVYSSYEEAVLEYSYIVNLYQGKSVMSSLLGAQTGTFDQDGTLLSGPLSSSLDGDHVSLKYPKFKFSYSRRIAEGISEEVNLNGNLEVFTGSIDMVEDQQEYDLQTILADDSEFSDSIGNNRITIRQVYYKTPHAMWRFYGYYGGMNTVGNMSTYGMFADDSTFEIIPPWQNKTQAMAYEDAIYTRNSHYSYELHNNKLRLYPAPSGLTPTKMWVTFTVHKEPWDEPAASHGGAQGINNLNTLPFSNIPYENINSIGKQWIRRFAFSISKEMLGQIRGKFGAIPIPGESVTLNASELLSQAKEEQEKLREELKTILEDLTYPKLAEQEASMANSTLDTVKNIPAGVFVG
jgi:hypothetical protein